MQNAEIEWNTAYQIPLKKPKSFTNTGSIRSAPSISIPSAVFKINSVILTMPPTCGAEMASLIVLLCIRLIFLPEITAIMTATVTTPMPPT